MKHLTVVGLACLLSACVSSVSDIRQAKPDKAADFPAAAEGLSGCVHQAMKSIDSPYEFRLIARPDKQEFYITTTRPSDAQREKTRLELHFIAHGETTTVEIREDPIGGRTLSSETWVIIERCSRQVATPPITSPTAP